MKKIKWIVFYRYMIMGHPDEFVEMIECSGIFSAIGSYIKVANEIRKTRNSIHSFKLKLFYI